MKFAPKKGGRPIPPPRPPFPTPLMFNETYEINMKVLYMYLGHPYFSPPPYCKLHCSQLQTLLWIVNLKQVFSILPLTDAYIDSTLSAGDTTALCDHPVPSPTAMAARALQPRVPPQPTWDDRQHPVYAGKYGLEIGLS